MGGPGPQAPPSFMGPDLYRKFAEEQTNESSDLQGEREEGGGGQLDVAPFN